MLIPSPRHTPEDLAHWATLERQDRAHATRLQPKVEEALYEIDKFLTVDHAYLGVSWGKDSVVVADLACRSNLNAPLVWVTEGALTSPEGPAVRDAFLGLYPETIYHEVKTSGQRDAFGKPEGFREAARLTGTRRYISGVRADESRSRTLRFRRWGASTNRTCAPISTWTADDVFSYLYSMRLPVHSAYAMTMGGRLDRRLLRVSSVGRDSLDSRGSGVGRLEWERCYYPERLARGSSV